MSRFINIYEEDYSDIPVDNFPVTLQKCRIMFDSENDNLVIQIKLINMGFETVEKVFLKVDLFDSENKLIKTINEHISFYLLPVKVKVSEKILRCMKMIKKLLAVMLLSLK